MIRLRLPDQLCALAGVEGEVELHVVGNATQKSVLDALEQRFPVLKGFLRDPQSFERRPFIRFFACGEDLSHQLLDVVLPSAVINGDEPFLIVTAIAGG